jgi:triacylglycerol lipase
MATGTTVERLNCQESLALHSYMSGPIKNLTFLQRSLVFAEISLISYLEPDVAAKAACRLGFPKVSYFRHAGAHGFFLANAWDVVVACRGTEPHDWNDIRANVNLWMEVAETVGKVHRGFKREMDRLWPKLEAKLVPNRLPLWFTGHSLGGAMATICAARCKVSYIRSNPEELYTFGSPRVGNRSYVSFSRLRHYRWVNNNDIVPTVPPTWLGYRHCGSECYLDHHGQHRKLTWSGRLRDAWLGLASSFMHRRVDWIADHSMFDYIGAIHRLTQEETLSSSSSLAERPVEPDAAPTHGGFQPVVLPVSTFGRDGRQNPGDSTHTIPKPSDPPADARWVA